MRGKGTDAELIGWTARLLTDRKVDIVIESNVIERHPVEAVIPQGSPVSPIRFEIYTSVVMEWVELNVGGAEGLCIVDNVGWVVTRNKVNQVGRKLKACAKVSIDCAERRELEFDTAKTELPLFPRRGVHKKYMRPQLTVMICMVNSFGRYNREATGWLGVWIDSHSTFKEYHTRYMK